MLELTLININKAIDTYSIKLQENENSYIYGKLLKEVINVKEKGKFSLIVTAIIPKELTHDFKVAFKALQLYLTKEFDVKPYLYWQTRVKNGVKEVTKYSKKIKGLPPSQKGIVSFELNNGENI